MMKIAAIFFTFFVSFNAFAENISEQQIVQNIIDESIANYSGRCPCPYNRASNGSSCGKRSAYSRAGGYSPLCYDSDVTPAMISNYKHKHGIRQ
jgi:hypothetical protein